ncbi:MAG: hypothetical protein FJ161_01780 [Gammaproteobacteria bacterium]|nr:hypothetical protein [Gammaproteobacteria bacterium]
MNLSNYIRICDAIVQLIEPLAEVVIHDLDKNIIKYINGNLSKRKTGDASLLDITSLNNIEKIVYPKVNFDGRLVKSISVLLEEKYLLCINCDVSIFNKMQEISNVLLQMGNPPESLFTNDWQEKLHVTIHSYLENHHLLFDQLSFSDKKKLSKHLFDLGAFQEKNAADYIAKILQLGRATIFKYLKEWRNQ